MDDPMHPAYLRLARSGALADRASRLEAILSCCTLCPRECGVDRARELGHCGTGVEAEVATWGPRHDLEPVLVGAAGAGVVAMANCNLHCVFCRPTSVPGDAGCRGRQVTADELAGLFLVLQDRGCHNLCWTAPSHQVPQLVRALTRAVRRGLRLPLAYQSNGYDGLETLRLLEGLVDVFVVDLKYSAASAAEELSGIPGYPERARAAIREMYRQVGEAWALGPEGTLRRGLLVRLQVLPYDLAGVETSLRWLSASVSPTVAVSLRAANRSCRGQESTQPHPALDRDLTPEEWALARWAAGEHMRCGDRLLVDGPGA